MKIAPSLLVAAPVVLLASCNQTPAPVDKEAVLAAIHEAENAQLKALNSGDPAGAAAVYGDDATLYLAGDQPAIGSEAIKASIEATLADPAFDAVMNEGSNKAWVSASGDLAVTGFTGNLTRTDTASGQPRAQRMANLTVWQKQADGSWKNVQDINMALPDAPEAAAE